MYARGCISVERGAYTPPQSHRHAAQRRSIAPPAFAALRRRSPAEKRRSVPYLVQQQDSFSTDTGCESGGENFEEGPALDFGHKIDFAPFIPARLVTVGYERRYPPVEQYEVNSARGAYLTPERYEDPRGRSRSTPTSPDVASSSSGHQHQPHYFPRKNYDDSLEADVELDRGGETRLAPHRKTSASLERDRCSQDFLLRGTHSSFTRQQHDLLQPVADHVSPLLYRKHSASALLPPNYHSPFQHHHHASTPDYPPGASPPHSKLYVSRSADPPHSGTPSPPRSPVLLPRPYNRIATDPALPTTRRRLPPTPTTNPTANLVSPVGMPAAPPPSTQTDDVESCDSAFFSQEEHRRHSLVSPQTTTRRLPVPKVQLQQATSDVAQRIRAMRDCDQQRRDVVPSPPNHKKCSLGSNSSGQESPRSPRRQRNEVEATRRQSLQPGALLRQSSRQQVLAATTNIDAKSSTSPSKKTGTSGTTNASQKSHASRMQDFSKSIRQASHERRDWSPPHSQTPSPPLWRQSGCPGYQPALHTNGLCSPNSRKLCHRRPSLQGPQEYVDTPCTCKGIQQFPNSIDNTPSTENVESNSDFDESTTSSGVHSPSSSQDVLRRRSGDDCASFPDIADGAGGGFSGVGVMGGKFDKFPCVAMQSYPPSSSLFQSGGSSNSCPENVNTLTVRQPPQRRRSSIFGGIGVLHFNVHYFAIRRRLRVIIHRAEGLAGQLRPDLELNTYVKLCLQPGKLQKQQSRTVKRSRDACFNEEFFFDNVTPREVEQKSLHMRVLHHLGKQFSKDPLIGEVEIALRDIHGLLTKKEIQLCEDLRPKVSGKKLGRIQFSTCIEKEAKRLTINIHKADDLPKYGFSGPPSPMVRIVVEQNGKQQTKQSRVLKSCTRAVYNEAIMFLISTKLTDLEHTSVVVAVHDTARTGTGDDIIGRVYLGQDSRDKSEIDQWANTLKNLGKEYKATHNLKRDDQDEA